MACAVRLRRRQRTRLKLSAGWLTVWMLPINERDRKRNDGIIGATISTGADVYRTQHFAHRGTPFRPLSRNEREETTRRTAARAESVWTRRLYCTLWNAVIDSLRCNRGRSRTGSRGWGAPVITTDSCCSPVGMLRLEVRRYSVYLSIYPWKGGYFNLRISTDLISLIRIRIVRIALCRL